MRDSGKYRQPPDWVKTESGILTPKEKIGGTVLKHKNYLDFAWNQSKRLTILCLLFGQAMVIYYYSHNNITINNISHYLVISSEVFFVTLFAVLFLLFYAGIPYIYLYIFLLIRNKKAITISTIAFAGLNAWLFFSIWRNWYIPAFAALGIIMINILLYALRKVRQKEVYFIYFSYLVPVIIFILFITSPQLQQYVMHTAGVIENPKSLFIKNNTSCDKKIILAKILHPSCTLDTTTHHAGGYTGYHHAETISTGKNTSLIKIVGLIIGNKKHTCTVTALAKNKDLFYDD